MITGRAERLQLRHHSVVEFVDRAHQKGPVTRAAHQTDLRAIRILFTREGEGIFARLSVLHCDELQRLRTTFMPPAWGRAP